MTGIDETAAREIALRLSDSERELLRTALRLLIATLGRDEADELREAQALLARLEDARPA